MKKDVELLPEEFEHTIYCQLSKRQQSLYDEFLDKKDSQNDDYVGNLNLLMQLQKICNHPDLIAPREVASPLTLAPLIYEIHHRFILDDDK